MRLILLRHAKSEKAEPDMRDRDRPLTARGQKDALQVDAYLVHHELLPDRVIVSPARRTRETWERLAAALPKPAPVRYDDGLYNASQAAIIEAIKGAPRTAQTLLVIGHNPGLHDAARLLVASGDVEARERLNEGLPTAGLVVIDFAGNDWGKVHPHGGRLERFLHPRVRMGSTD